MLMSYQYPKNYNITSDQQKNIIETISFSNNPPIEKVFNDLLKYKAKCHGDMCNCCNEEQSLLFRIINALFSTNFNKFYTCNNCKRTCKINSEHCLSNKCHPSPFEFFSNNVIAERESHISYEPTISCIQNYKNKCNCYFKTADIPKVFFKYVKGKVKDDKRNKRKCFRKEYASKNITRISKRIVKGIGNRSKNSHVNILVSQDKRIKNINVYTTLKKTPGSYNKKKFPNQFSGKPDDVLSTIYIENKHLHTPNNKIKILPDKLQNKIDENKQIIGLNVNQDDTQDGKKITTDKIFDKQLQVVQNSTSENYNNKDQPDLIYANKSINKKNIIQPNKIIQSTKSEQAVEPSITPIKTATRSPISQKKGTKDANTEKTNLNKQDTGNENADTKYKNDNADSNVRESLISPGESKKGNFAAVNKLNKQQDPNNNNAIVKAENYNNRDQSDLIESTKSEQTAELSKLTIKTATHSPISQEKETKDAITEKNILNKQDTGNKNADNKYNNDNADGNALEPTISPREGNKGNFARVNKLNKQQDPKNKNTNTKYNNKDHPESLFPVEQDRVDSFTRESKLYKQNNIEGNNTNNKENGSNNAFRSSFPLGKGSKISLTEKKTLNKQRNIEKKKSYGEDNSSSNALRSSIPLRKGRKGSLIDERTLNKNLVTGTKKYDIYNNKESASRNSFQLNIPVEKGINGSFKEDIKLNEQLQDSLTQKPDKSNKNDNANMEILQTSVASEKDVFLGRKNLNKQPTAQNLNNDQVEIQNNNFGNTNNDKKSNSIEIDNFSKLSLPPTNVSDVSNSNLQERRLSIERTSNIDRIEEIIGSGKLIPSGTYEHTQKEFKRKLKNNKNTISSRLHWVDERLKKVIKPNLPESRTFPPSTNVSKSAGQNIKSLPIISRKSNLQETKFSDNRNNYGQNHIMVRKSNERSIENDIYSHHRENASMSSTKQITEEVIQEISYNEHYQNDIKDRSSLLKRTSTDNKNSFFSKNNKNANFQKHSINLDHTEVVLSITSRQMYDKQSSNLTITKRNNRLHWIENQKHQINNKRK